jgi:hypothetical protein
MNSAFFTLFKRGRYYCGKQPDDSAGQISEHNEAERFAVAATAFCLRYDETFRKHFFEKVCWRNGDPKLSNEFEVDVEPIHWADLRIANGNFIYVVEFKIRAKLDAKQNPNKPEFQEPDGYGSAMAEKGIQRYIVLGWEGNLELGDGKTVKIKNAEIVCQQRAWSDLELFEPSKMVRDLFYCLGYLNVPHFELMKAKDIQVKFPLNEAVNAILVLNAINNRFGLKGENYSDLDNSSWWFGYNVYPKGKNSEWLVKLTGIQDRCAAWFGFQGKTNAESQRAVWFYCCDEMHAKAIESQINSFETYKKHESKEQPDCWDIEVISPIGQSPNDCEWFRKIFERLGLS